MLVFAEITTRLHLAKCWQRLVVVVAVRMIRKMTSVYQPDARVVRWWSALRWAPCGYLLHLTGWCPQHSVYTQSLSAGWSHTWKPLCWMWWSCRRRDCMLLMILRWWPIKQIPMRLMSLKGETTNITITLIARVDWIKRTYLVGKYCD